MPLEQLTTAQALVALGAAALALVAQASQTASEAGLGWRTEPLVLTPAPRLVELIRRSQDIAAAGESDG